MRRSHFLAAAWAVAFCTLAPFHVAVYGDTFGTGQYTLQIDFVTVGDPGNPPHMRGWPRPAGSVPYTYRMGKYEVSTDMILKANAATAGTPDPLEITIDQRDNNKPATSISWIEAAKFVNWLNTSSGYAPAYKFEDVSDIRPPPPNAILDGFALWEPEDPGYDPANRYRNRLAYYFLPNVDEWYKAAYYEPVAGVYFWYPTSELTVPLPVVSGTEPNTAVYDLDPPAGPADVDDAGGLTPYGTMAQGGNISEWMETEIDLVNDDIFELRIGRGGMWESSLSTLGTIAFGSALPRQEFDNHGFRVASLPEPGTLGLMVLGLACSLILRLHITGNHMSMMVDP